MNVSFQTPDVVIRDARGCTVREIQYHRHPQSPDITNTRITRHKYDVRGSLTKSIDPRLYNLMQSDSTIKPNIVYHRSLTGSVLRSESVDDGSSVALADAAGRPVLAVNATGAIRLWQYEGVSLPGRLLTITEQFSGGTPDITERFIYADNTTAEQHLNLAGQCTCHYDTDGRTQLKSKSLIGGVLSQNRQHMQDDFPPNWSGADENAWNVPLTGATYETLHTTDSTGAVLTTTDASGNVQRMAYDVAGQLKGAWLMLRGGKEQIIIKSLTWSAGGQKLREEHGNGVVSTFIYEATTQRLTGMKTERLSGHPAGAKVLQDLRYEYDPVGNVLKVKNDAEVTRFWYNQQIVPENTYTYDSLYQLVSATGREMTGIAQQSRTPPSARQALITDPAAFTAWTRNYEYDAGGNLSRIRHRTPAMNSGYTTDMTISNRSNRGALSTTTADAAVVDSLFTAGGQQKSLVPGQGLGWTVRGELAEVTLVARQEDIPDVETYRYDSTSQRTQKINTQKMGSITQKQRTVYLPGLELRTTVSGGIESENLQVIIVGAASRASVRVLHWEKGRPDIMSSNDQVRYSYGNLIQSAGLEVDGRGLLVSQEEYYPYGGTAVCAARNAVEAVYKIIRYSGKERDATGLYYYGYRFYQPWAGRWLSADPAGTVDGLNLYRMVRNNPITLMDRDGLMPTKKQLYQNDQIYNRLKNISSSAETVNNNLNMGSHEIAGRASVNMLASLAAGSINYAMGMFVPAIETAPAALAGLTGTIAGDVVNTALQKLVGTDLTYRLEMETILPSGTNSLSDFASDIILPRVKDYAFAISTQNSFPYAASDALEGSSRQNFVVRNINDASNLIYGRGQLAQMAHQDSKVLMEEVNRLESLAYSNIGGTPDTAHTIAGATMTKSAIPIFGKERMVAQFAGQVKKTRNSLMTLNDNSMRIGYPGGWYTRHTKSYPAPKNVTPVISQLQAIETRYIPGAQKAKTAAARRAFFENAGFRY